MKKVLTIAGSDSSGGAGIQADLKTMTVHGVFGMSAITALTAQNTVGVQGIFNSSPEFLKQQLDSVFDDIFPDAIKIGMVSGKELIQTIIQSLKEWKAEKIVVDPVMVATSGGVLLEEESIENLKELCKIATIITPNIPEAEVLSGISIETKEDMEKVGSALSKDLGTAVLIKGGHGKNDANDVFVQGEKILWFYGKRIDNDNTHGTGCTLSSAIASNLAKGFSLEESIEKAKDYLSKILADDLDLGKGRGPLNHMA